ncbi:MAG: Cys-tRNA(Pro) deacylase [Candidatus Bruticola sp.]
MDKKLTNVMRILKQKKVPFIEHTYTANPSLKAEEIAAEVGLPAERVFKTLVTVGKSGGHYVFAVPANSHLNLKKAAATVKEKSIEMIPQKDLLPLTGYVHGGCSPIGMKKNFPALIDESCLKFATIAISAGKVGFQVEIDPRLLGLATASLV